MRALDLSPLFRSTVGFDRFDRLFDQASRIEAPTGYPPYNIEKQGEDKYRITMAVAGFKDEDIEIVSQDGTLVVTGKGKEQAETDTNVTYLHRGIAARAFERRFALADTVKVTEAKLENGLLHIDLVHEVPEERKPRTIKIAKAA